MNNVRATMRGVARAWAAPAFVSFCLAGLCAGLIFRDGIEVTPDGWAYWQGSVSLVESGTYSYFENDEPIRLWPPAYSVYLAGWQAGLGVSGRTLVLANVLLIALAAALWTTLSLQLLEPFFDRLHDAYRYLIASYLALFFAVSLRFLLATNLLYVLMPIFFLATVASSNHSSPLRLVSCAVAAAFAGALALLTHNSALAIMPVAGVMALTNRALSLRTRLIFGSAVVILAVIPWYLVRSALEQGGSHAIGWGTGRYGPIEYLVQMLTGTAHLIGSKPGLLIVPGLAFVVLYAALRTRRESSDLNRALSNSLLLAAVPASLLFAMFNLTYIADSLSGRFLLFVPALLVPLALGSWAALRPSSAESPPVTRWRKYAAVCLILVFGISLQRCAKRIVEIAGPPTPQVTNVRYNQTVRSDFLNQPPCPTESGLVIISPPNYDFSNGSPHVASGRSPTRR